MCVVLDKEIAIVGLLNFLFSKRVEGLTNREIHTSEEYSIELLNGTFISVKKIFDYCDWLNSANCGPVIKKFDSESILMLLEEKTNFFKRENSSNFIIKLSENYRIIESNDEKAFMDNIQKLLINEFRPNMNYPRRFIKFLGLTTEEQSDDSKPQRIH